MNLRQFMSGVRTACRTCPGADALVIARQVVLFVRRMDVVVVETEADQQAIKTERVLEIGDDRNRAAGADHDRLLAPLFGQGLLGGRKRLHGPVERDRRRRRMVAELDRTIGGNAC
jgi:hypothetical protein